MLNKIFERFGELFEIIFKGGNDAVVVMAITITLGVMFFFFIAFRKTVNEDSNHDEKQTNREDEGSFSGRQSTGQPSASTGRLSDLTPEEVEQGIVHYVQSGTGMPIEFDMLQTKKSAFAGSVYKEIMTVAENAVDAKSSLAGKSNESGTEHYGNVTFDKSGSDVNVKASTFRFTVPLNKLSSLSNPNNVVKELQRTGTLSVISRNAHNVKAKLEKMNKS